MPAFKDNIILMRVSVPENEIVCYTVDNAISNAKVRMQMWGARPPVEKSDGARAHAPPSDAYDPVTRKYAVYKHQRARH